MGKAASRALRIGFTCKGHPRVTGRSFPTLLVERLKPSFEKRWKAAQVNDAVVFVNGSDAPIYWSFDQPIPRLRHAGDCRGSNACGHWAHDRFRGVCAWKGIIFPADVEMDAERVRHRVVWSGVNRPLSWVPGDDTIAGIRILTTASASSACWNLGLHVDLHHEGIWQVSHVGGDQVFQFTRKYYNDAGDQCLAYPNTPRFHWRLPPLHGP